MSRFAYYYDQYARAAQTGRQPFAGGPTAAGPLHRPAPARALSDAYATLWLRPGAPEVVVKAAYRALAQVYHPDAGGNAAIMARINAAYAAVQRHLHAEQARRSRWRAGGN